MENLVPLLTLLLGWLLGLLSPAIVERIRRSYRVAAVSKAIVAELEELKYNLALSAYLFAHRTASLDDKTLDLIGSAVSTYDGPLKDPKMAEGIKTMRSFPEKDRLAYLASTVDESLGMNVKTLSLPLLTAHLTEISLFPVPFQAAVMRIKAQLEVYNQNVESIRHQYDLTFTATGSNNQSALRQNQRAG